VRGGNDYVFLCLARRLSADLRGFAPLDYFEVLSQLRFCVSVIKKKSHNFLKYFFADVHRSVNVPALRFA